jgi:hypothetical protein
MNPRLTFKREARCSAGESADEMNWNRSRNRWEIAHGTDHHCPGWRR